MRQAFEVLDGCDQQELVPGTSEATQPEPCEGELTLRFRSRKGPDPLGMALHLMCTPISSSQILSRQERSELLQELKALHQEQAEAQRHRLDAEHWQSIAAQAKRDYDNRQDLIEEVERIQREYEDAATDLAARNEELAELTRRHSNLSVEIETAQEKLKELEEQR